MTLFHYTCRHAAAKLTRYALLVPQPHQLLGARVVWLTDQEQPDREALGLTNSFIDCDRTEVRYVARGDAEIVPWLESPVRAAMTVRARAILEDGRRPAWWYVALQPVAATRDRVWDERRRA